MRNINTKVQAELGHKTPIVHPQHVFTLITGTSTGGLIAIMLGKLGMTVQECIKAYHDLSKKIFGKKHIRGAMTGGLGPTRYSGTRLRDTVRRLLEGRNFDPDLDIIHDDQAVHEGLRTLWYAIPTPALETR
jgi:hypothetical protein